MYIYPFRSVNWQTPVPLSESEAAVEKGRTKEQYTREKWTSELVDPAAILLYVTKWITKTKSPLPQKQHLQLLQAICSNKQHNLCSDMYNPPIMDTIIQSQLNQLHKPSMIASCCKEYMCHDHFKQSDLQQLQHIPHPHS